MNIRNFKVSCKTTSLLVFLITSLAFVYTCNATTTGSGDGGNGNPPKPCSEDPFGSHCFTDTTYNTPRQMKCLANPMIDDSCRGETGIITTFCKASPFSTESACTENPNILDFKVASCRDVTNNNKDSSCMELLLVKANDLPTYPAQPDTTTRQSQFLAGTPTGINMGMDTPFEAGGVTYSGNLNLATATYNSVALDGDSTNGVAFYWGTSGGTNNARYAGIYSGTNMGALLIETTGTARWNGQFQVVHPSYSLKKDFILEVNYETKRVEAFVLAQDRLYYYLDSKYNELGVITGTSVLDIFTNSNRNTPNVDPSIINFNITGNFIGLIGQDGAVGAFHSIIGAGGYSGGFVAQPSE